MRLAPLGIVVAAAATLCACGEEGESAAATAEAEPSVVMPITTGPAWLGDYLDCLSRRRTTLAAAHRGGPEPGYPENAIETFAHTLAQGPALIEADVGATGDGVLVLMHDDTLERTTTCEGALAESSWFELMDCRLRDDDGRATDFVVPQLADALAWSQGRTILELDIKDSVAFEDVAAAVRAAGAENRVILITYSAAAAARLAGLAPEMIISAPISDLPDLEELEGLGVAASQLVAWTGTDAPWPALNAALEASDVPVIFGTLGDPGSSIDADIARSGDEHRYVEIADTGVDIIATDRAFEASQALRTAKNPAPSLAACRTRS